MNLKRAQAICDRMNLFDEAEPDISTESLFARVCASYHCDEGDIGEALLLTEEQKQKDDHGIRTPAKTKKT